MATSRMIDGQMPSAAGRRCQAHSPEPAAPTGALLQQAVTPPAVKNANTSADADVTARRLEPAALRERVAELNRIAALRRHRLEFSIHEATGRLVVRVTDRATDALVRQFPPEQLLEIAAHLREALAGGLSDERG